jgi:hypothetical protein
VTSTSLIVEEWNDFVLRFELHRKASTRLD